VEIEKVGIPVAQITTMTPVALMVGSGRIIPGAGICHPVGNVDLEPKLEKALRQATVEKALEALRTEAKEPMVFPRPTYWIR
jgi:glycine/betaine/sarcosine/D-proline reductase family selenoprotein B